ncbi:MAG: UDP-N-acetylmuramoyl-L-alanyl-D-glutamate--2,6-diaminopimelate ligase [Halieaceae bacterium MED-G27]|jgi:UDP-N-acetylmuramoyl-L-alanyl-D-glutamate--2,6-diaminopimelate ligase|nr:UDP-N-acetylmuramoyl-L-alanyl-D-glutamate--2,6-diaminopimelate ligase [Halieaceae bacterium]OUT65741.1 MAG: UDP-N-acetylmuramoyl-L-alanyl-D-glutamate--2,6-diaminopimelate ligase [Cellvibrionales bacterium TMED21]PDH38779.1 MAG: UDP-N-acetylmuramoyl-L-alanyl-D-glutamate--2,6-diaminopimelate ligase [Halieaceae bacterium MED-G27]|tara:strand:- start:22512 stop:23987 length:1476 start_codon:yes stop_codon:yes gene_type:complete
MGVPSLTLDALLKDIVAPVPAELATVTPADVALDSRLVEAGDLFVAVPGIDGDGRHFVEGALGAGASSVLAEASDFESNDPRVIAIPNLRAYCGLIARRFYRNPSSDMTLTAVTGTNGKTSVTDYIAQLLRLLGQPAGIIGTLGSRLVSGEISDAVNTTPDIFTLSRTLDQWRDDSIQYVALEASSHALAQHRLDGLSIHTGVFTNLTRDHLDYHGSIDAYCDAKLALFRDFDLAKAVYNADDAMSAQVASIAQCPALGISLTDSSADILVALEAEDSQGLRAKLHSPYGTEHLDLPLHGTFNAFNVAAAIATLVGMGFSFSELCSASHQLHPVAGRMELVGQGAVPRVVVDYAHTPDALQRAMLGLRSSVSGKLWVVFGCGGDRDTGKRPIMGRIAEQYADCVIVTNDNPRHESPQQIAEDIVSGCLESPAIQLDRAAAIHHAILNADDDDTILIAGKGHEPYQLVAGRRLPFSDGDVAQEALEIRGRGA